VSKGISVKRGLVEPEKLSLEQAKRQLRRLNARAIKGLGQHFLIDSDVLKTIVAAAELTPDDTVIEVGPGLGILTEALLEKAGRVITVEVDRKLTAALEQKFACDSRLKIINANILELEPGKMTASDSMASGHLQSYKVVANLPYYIASPILRHFLEASPKPGLMVITVQKEVGQSIAAGYGVMSLQGISVQLYGRPEIVDYISAGCFYPKPKVDSAIVRIDVYPKPVIDEADIPGFFNIVKAGFSAPRKQLRNSLSLGLDVDVSTVNDILKRANIDAQRRPQTLTIEEWDRISRVYINRG